MEENQTFSVLGLSSNVNQRNEIDCHYIKVRLDLDDKSINDFSEWYKLNVLKLK